MRKRRRWLFPVFALVLTATGWWVLRREQPLPEFLRKFEDRTTRVDAEIVGAGANIRIFNFYLVEAPASSVVIALADNVGSGNVAVSSTSAQSLVNETGVEAFVREDGSQFAMVRNAEPVPALHQWLGSWIPGWIERRFGPNNWVFPTGAKPDLLDLKELRRLRVGRAAGP